MLKGIQKQMVMVKTNNSSLFETAYFVLRDDAARDDGDIVSEANSIVECALPSPKRKGARRGEARKRRGISFFIGLVCGALASAVALVLLGGI